MSQDIWQVKDSILLQRQDRRSQLVTSYLKKSNAQIVLDIGCAEGYATSFFSKIGVLVIGIELDRSNLDIAKRKVKNVEFVNGSIDSLPFRDGVFNAVCVLEVLEHLDFQTQKRGLREADRVLTRDGSVTISIPYKENIIQTKCIHCGIMTPLYGHLRSLDESDIKEVLPDNEEYNLIERCQMPNLQIISCRAVFRPLPLRVWLLLNKILGAISRGYWMVLHYKKGL